LILGVLYYRSSDGVILKTKTEADFGRHVFSTKISYNYFYFPLEENLALYQDIKLNGGYWIDIAGPTLMKGAVPVNVAQSGYLIDLDDHWVQGMTDLNQIINSDIDLDLGVPVANLAEANISLEKIEDILALYNTGIKNLAVIVKKLAKLTRYIYDQNVPEEE